MNLCSPIIRVMFFTNLAESSQVAQRNLKLCKCSFNASVVKNGSVIDYMPYGLESRGFTITKTDVIF
jgi:hypothetical protein